MFVHRWVLKITMFVVVCRDIIGVLFHEVVEVWVKTPGQTQVVLSPSLGKHEELH